MFRAIFIVFVQLVLISAQDHRITFRDDSMDYGSVCQTTLGYGVCSSLQDCANPMRAIILNQKPSTCFFYKLNTPIFCCPVDSRFIKKFNRDGKSNFLAPTT
uniref:Putative secreted protein n=1 Tax=Lutzomyia longipalpis TaxID=7200 RepID=A0A7G3APJ0_LUTLO